MPEVLADVAELGPFFTVGTGPIPPGSGWRPTRELYTDPQPLSLWLRGITLVGWGFAALVALRVRARLGSPDRADATPALKCSSLHLRLKLDGRALRSGDTRP